MWTGNGVVSRALISLASTEGATETATAMATTSAIRTRIMRVTSPRYQLHGQAAAGSGRRQVTDKPEQS